MLIGTTDSPLVGTWVYSGNAKVSYTFNADGTGASKSNDDVWPFEYKDNGTSVEIIYEDVSGTFGYSISDNTLTMKDGSGSEVKYIKQ